MVHFPLEILGIITDIMIAEYGDTDDGYKEVLLPRWFLVPLLRVCKEWYPFVETFLYHSISVGDKFPHSISQIEDEPTDGESTRMQESSTMDTNRSGRKIAEDLTATIERNARLAALVKELRLGIDSESWAEPSNPELTRICIRILQLCPNVEHVWIRDPHRSEGDALYATLKDKSLVSFYASHWDSCLDSSRILKLMQNWPNLRRIELLEQWCSPGFEPGSLTFDATRVPTLCPALHTLILNDENVTDDTMLSALSKYLSTWSSTLTCLKLTMGNNRPVNQHLNKALSSLIQLIELHVYGMDLDTSPVSELPRLTILALDGSDKQLESLAILLEDLDKFPALNMFGGSFHCGSSEIYSQLQDVCSGRNIKIPNDTDQFFTSTMT